MARILDRLCCTALLAAAVFLFTLRFSDSVLLAALAAACAPLPVQFLMRRLASALAKSPPLRRRVLRKRAGQTIQCWASLRSDACRSDLLALLRTAYPNANLHCIDDCPPDGIPVFPLLTLRPVNEDAAADRLVRAQSGGFPKCVLAATAAFTPEARALTLLPDLPMTALIDADMLAALLTRHPNAVPFRSLQPMRMPKIHLSRAHALRLLPAVLAMYCLYMLFGIPFCLPAAALLFWLMLWLAHKRGAPALFP